MNNTAFLFPGQGSQAVGMGVELHEAYDVAREVFDMAEEISRIRLRRLCFKGPMESLTETVNLQPAVTAVNLACLAVIRREGGDAGFCAGHSLGEFSALVSAAVVSPEDALRLVLRRGELMHRESLKHKGAMAAIVGLDIDAVDDLVTRVRQSGGGPLSVANHNTAQQIVITGTPPSIEQAATLASKNGARAIPLKVSGAWHSELIKGAEKEFEELLLATEFREPRIPVVHNVTAAVASDPVEIRSLMARQFCSPVRWYDSMKYLYDNGVRNFAEVGPGRVLSGLLKKILPKDADCRLFAVGDLAGLETFLTAVS